jgi:hypothetical protein
MKNEKTKNQLSNAFKKIEASKLTRRAIVLLLQDQTDLSQRDINAVLDAAPKLEKYYTKAVSK